MFYPKHLRNLLEDLISKISFLGLDLDEELKRSLYDIIDVEETCPFFNFSRLSPSEDNIELSYCDLTDNYLRFSPVSGRTPEIKSPLNFDMASPTNVSNVEYLVSLKRVSGQILVSRPIHETRNSFFPHFCITYI